jgi:RNAse (barnase) inhibitor barstar
MKAVLATLAAARASGVFRAAPLGTAPLPAALPAPLELREIVLVRIRDKDAFLSACARALRFPEYFGHNWDAFYDCLADIPEAQLVLLLRAASEFARADPEEFAAAMDTFAEAAQLWADAGRSLLVVIELESALLAPELQEISVRSA